MTRLPRSIYPAMLLAIASVSMGSVLDGLIPLTCEQIEGVNTAIADGTVRRISEELAVEGTIPFGDAAFPQIVTPTPEQQRVLDECYTPYVYFSNYRPL